MEKLIISRKASEFQSTCETSFIIRNYDSMTIIFSPGLSYLVFLTRFCIIFLNDKVFNSLLRDCSQALQYKPHPYNIEGSDLK